MYKDYFYVNVIRLYIYKIYYSFTFIQYSITLGTQLQIHIKS